MDRYCEKFKLENEYILDELTWIRYINRKDLIEDTNCGLICTSVQQWVCHILNHFENVKQNREGSNIQRLRKSYDSYWSDDWQDKDEVQDKSKNHKQNKSRSFYKNF